MSEERATMDEITCHTEPITKGFKFRWTIAEFGRVLSGMETLKSPVFKALSWNWMIEMRRETSEYPNDLDFWLNLVDESGNKLAVIPNETFFNTNEMCIIISLINEDGELLVPIKKLEGVVLRDRLNRGSDSYTTYVPMTGSKLLNIINDRGVDRVQLNLELCGLAGISAKVSVKNSMDTIEKINSSRMKLFDQGKFSDFLIRTGDGREIRAHRNILSATSGYFEALFDLGGLEVQRGEIEVPESFAVMNELIRFLYSGKFPKIEKDGSNFAMEMFIAADKYQIDELKEHFEEMVVASFSVESVCADLAKVHIQSVGRMKAKEAEFIRTHRAEVEKTDGWRKLCRDHPEIIDFL